MNWVDWTLITIAIAILGVIIWLVNENSKWIYSVRVKLLTNNKRIIFTTRAKRIKDEEGVLYWGFKEKAWRHLKFPVPPPEAIDINEKGQLCADCYMNTLQEITWIEDKGFPTFYQPLTTNQRLIQVNQIKKALLKKGLDWKLYLPMLIGLGFCAIVIVGTLALIGEPIKQLNDFTNVVRQDIKDYKTSEVEQLRIIKQIDDKIQLIEARTDGTNFTRPTAPN